MRHSSLLFLLLFGMLALRADPVTIRLTSVPDNTPHDATLYLASNLNDWNPGDPGFQFELQPDSSYAITLAAAPDSFAYKVTRGNWPSVEGRRNGRAIPNRTYLASMGPEVKIKVHTWEDLARGLITVYNFFLVLSAFQGLLLILAINTIQDNNLRANRLLSGLILLISVALIGHAWWFDRDFFHWQPKLFLLPEMIFFLYGPTFYFYLLELLKVEDKKWTFPRWAHYVPAAIHLLSYLPWLLLPNQDFIDRVLELRIHTYIAIAGGLALLFNAAYWWRCWDILNHYEDATTNTQSFEQNLRYLRYVMALLAVCLGMWLFTFLISAAGLVFDFDSIAYREIGTDAIWLVFSVITFLLGFFAINHPEIFKVAKVKVAEKYKDSPMDNDELSRYKTRLKRAMEEEQVFLNPELTLSQLAEKVATNTHTLSRVINEGYERSFYDYINGYRVREFARLVMQEENQKETFLAIAFRVGFNSKTTFNRAFKKITGTTPRQYLKEQQEKGLVEV